jgi:valyl-tRNA synthetase
MGHALDGSLQDVIYRFKMLDGYRTYWASGTDHAGISAQSKVEKLLSADGIDPKKLSRNDLFNTIDT